MTSQPSTPSSTAATTGPGMCGDSAPGRSVAALSSRVLILARRECQESPEGFADRAGVAPEVMSEAENGTQPAWALPYDEFTAIADAVSAVDPGLRVLFEAATACDLLLNCVLDGDQVLATDVLVEPASRDLARALLRLAAAGELDHALAVPGLPRVPGEPPVLSDTQVALLRDRAAALAASESPDAWVGEEILAACRGGRS